MTPFGRAVRALRRKKGVTLKDMAHALGVSPAYLSALEHGRRARPTPARVDQICAYFGIIWEDADHMKALARMSHPRVVVDTTGLSPDATELANRLAQRIRHLDRRTVRDMLDMLETEVE